MASVATAPRKTPQMSAGGLQSRPSGVMPAFRGKVSLPTPSARASLPRQSMPQPVNDNDAWAAALAAAKQRIAREEELREWQAAIARARELVADEEHEWAALRVKAQPPRRPPQRPAPRLVSWP